MFDKNPQVTPNGGLVRESFQNAINSGLGNKYSNLPRINQGIVGCTPTNVPLWEIPI